MSKLELNQKTRELLDRVRHQPKFLSVFEMPADLAEAAVWEIGKIGLEDKAVPLVQQNGYRWYLRELSKLLRTKTDWDLALELEICLRKWVGYGLDQELLQVLLCECYDRIGAMTVEEIEESPKLETRMTNQARSPNEETAKDAKTAKPKPDSTTKTPRHEVAPESDSGPLESSNPGVPQPVTMGE